MDIGSIWDAMLDELDYLIHFEWISDIGEFFSGMFTDISEISYVGLAYGVIMVVLVYLFRKSVFAFVNTMEPGVKIIAYPVFFIFAFVIGYIMGRKVWDT